MTTLRTFLPALLLPTLLLPMCARADCQISAVELPVTMSGSRALVTATISDAKVDFVLDSGAFFSFITPAAAEQLQLSKRRAPEGLRVEGVTGRVDVLVTRVKDFTLTKTVFHNVDFIVGGNEVGANAVGLLGQNFLDIADIEYDLGKSAVRIVEPSADCKTAKLAYWAGSAPYSEIELERPPGISKRATTGIAYVNDVKMRVEFDTGATTSILSLQAAKRAGLEPGGEGVVPAGVTHGMGEGEARNWIAPVRSFRIGGEQIKNTHLRISDIMKASDIDMLLGADFFLSHRVYVANSQQKIYFTYNGGPTFDLSVSRDPWMRAASAPSGEPTATEDPSTAPTDAKGYARRGAALASRRDFQAALADLTRACELDPGVGKNFLLRGQIRLALAQQFLAMSDFNEALRLTPNDVDARLARARLLIAGHEAESARADLAVADQVSARQANSRLEIARLYMNLDLPQAALPEYDQWIDSHEKDVDLAAVLNSRCWARALLGTQLDQALADCNAAIKARPDTAVYLDSRGLVNLRQGAFDKAISDYDAALRINPKLAWSLYGRGIARLHNGATDAGNADIAAAKVILPSIVADTKRHGID